MNFISHDPFFISSGPFYLFASAGRTIHSPLFFSRSLILAGAANCRKCHLSHSVQSEAPRRSPSPQGKKEAARRETGSFTEIPYFSNPAAQSCGRQTFPHGT